MGKLRLRKTSGGSIEIKMSSHTNKVKTHTNKVKRNAILDCKRISVGSMKLSKSTSGKVYWCPSDKNIIVEMHGQWHS